MSSQLDFYINLSLENPVKLGLAHGEDGSSDMGTPQFFLVWEGTGIITLV